MRKDTKYKANFLIGFNRHKITLKMATKVETLTLNFCSCLVQTGNNVGTTL